MKFLIVALPNFVKDEQIYSMLSDIVGSNMPEGVDLPESERRVPAIIVEAGQFSELEKAIKATKKAQRPFKYKESEFVRACNGVFDVLAVEEFSTLSEVGFRGAFYKNVLNGVIERPILEVIAFGPRNANDVTYIQNKKCACLVEYANVALSLLA